MTIIILLVVLAGILGEHIMWGIAGAAAIWTVSRIGYRFCVDDDLQ